MKKQCAWCKRTETRDGQWVVADLVNAKNITHGICPECNVKWFTGADTLPPALMAPPASIIDCYPCRHCNGGDREDKFFGYQDQQDGERHHFIDENGIDRYQE